MTLVGSWGAFKVGSIATYCWQRGNISKDERVLSKACKLKKGLSKAIKAKKYRYQELIRRIGPIVAFVRQFYHSQLKCFTCMSTGKKGVGCK